MNHMMGCGAGWGWNATAERDKYYPVLQAPAGGRHYMVGDQISHHSSWQEGALASVEHALLDFDERVRAQSGETRKA